MDTQDLFARQEQRQQRALQILAQLDLIQRWSVYGRAVLVGAVAHGLVVAPDIDLEIYCPAEPRLEEGFAILLDCARMPQVRAVRFANHLDEADQGYYWSLRYRADADTIWKVDMWSVRYDHPGPTGRELIEPLQRTLTADTRATILTIKEHLLTEPTLKCPSIYIYLAVLRDGIRTPDEFLAWRALHPGEELITWLPG